MVVIRMARYGSKKRPFYRIVAIDSRKPRNGRPIEYLGFFNPIAKEHEEKVKINKDRIHYWTSVGAQMSNRVLSIFKNLQKV